MSHVDELLAGAWDRGLSFVERRDVDDHLAACGRCRALAFELERNDRLIAKREVVTHVPPFARIRAREGGWVAGLAVAGATVAVLLVVAVWSSPVRPEVGAPVIEPSPTSTRPAGSSPTPSIAPSPSPSPSADATSPVSSNPFIPQATVPRGTSTSCPADPSYSPVPAETSRTDFPNAYREGMIRVRIAPCRDIDELLRRYGLPGPVWYFNRPPFGEAARRVGLDRDFLIGVRIGDEHSEAERLKGSPSDFEYVTLHWQVYVCTERCGPQPEVSPPSGPRGTQFRLQFCCWPAGAAVEKIFTRPDGQVTTIADSAREDGTVPAGWGSGADDPLGTYTVKVRGSGLAEVLTFRIE